MVYIIAKSLFTHLFRETSLHFGDSIFFLIYILKTAKVGYFAAFWYSKKRRKSCFMARMERDCNLQLRSGLFKIACLQAYIVIFIFKSEFFRQSIDMVFNELRSTFDGPFARDNCQPQYRPNNLLDKGRQGPKMVRKLSERCKNQFTGEKTSIFRHIPYPVLTDFSISPVGGDIKGASTQSLKNVPATK